MGFSAFAVFFIYMMLFALGQNIIGGMKRTQNIPRSESPAKLILHMLMSLLLLPAGIYAKHQEVHNVLIAPACIFAAVGLFISMWAQWELGNNWVGGLGVHKRHKLITTGPYRFVRHPLYTGIGVSSLGIGICSLNPVFLAMMAAWTFGFALRWKAEDALMAARFRKQYPRYAAKTGTFVPKIRR